MVTEEAFLTTVATSDRDAVESLAKTRPELATRPEGAAWS